MIPKTIHCCWFGGPKTRLAERCLASWRRFAPGFEIVDWDEKKLRGVFGRGGAPALPRFAGDALAAGKWAMVSDWLRMAALYEYGGVYFDLDVELVAPIDDLLDREWCSSEWTAGGETWLNPGGGIALEKGSAVAGTMLAAYAGTAFDPARAMMPFINENLSRAITRAASGFRTLAPEVFSPIDCRGRMHRTAATRGIHHYAMGAEPRWRRAVQWLSWHGGQPVVDALVAVKRALAGKGIRG